MTVRTPIASPVHQTDHVGQKSAASSTPVRTSVPVPVVELTSMPVKAPRKISARASRRRSSSLWNPARRSRAYEQRGASVLPAVMARTAGTDGPSETLVRNAPSAIPGQTRGPSRSRPASAIPLGGQRGVTWPRTSCWSSPSSAEP